MNQEFQSAPMGRCIYRTIIGVLAFAVFVALVQAAIHFGAWKTGAVPYRDGLFAVARRPLSGLMTGLLITILFMIPAFYYERSKVARFAIKNNCLVLGKKRFPLEGMEAAERDPEVLRWAVKVYGNGGLGAIRGRYWSRRLGKFEAFLTGTENAVVLRWPDKKVVVSPADTEFFITCAKSAAGIR
jgi:hypothetical protein